MNGRILLILSVMITMPLAGCGYVPEGDTVHINFHGSFDTTESGIHINGDLVAERRAAEQDVYRNVTINLFAENGTLLYQEELGDLKARVGRLNVSIKSEFVPRYITFESLDFWNEQMTVDYYEKVDEGYAVYEATSRSELPEKRTKE